MTEPTEPTAPAMTLDEAFALLTIKPYTLATLPNEQTLLAAGRIIISESPTWKKGKSFVNGTVSTTRLPKSKGNKEREIWHARHSVHPSSEMTFDEFWEGLGTDKPIHECGYIPTLSHSKLLKTLSPISQIHNLYYVFPSPLISNRLMTVLQICSLSPPNPQTGLREALIVSVPVDMQTGDEGCTRAIYVSVELLQEQEGKGGKETVWRMAVSSLVGGWIPPVVFNGSMPKEISDDVPFFIKYMKGRRNQAKPAEAGNGAVAATAAAMT